MSFTLGAGVTHLLQPVDAVRDTRAETAPAKDKRQFKTSRLTIDWSQLHETERLGHPRVLARTVRWAEKT